MSEAEGCCVVLAGSLRLPDWVSGRKSCRVGAPPIFRESRGPTGWLIARSLLPFSPPLVVLCGGALPHVRESFCSFLNNSGPCGEWTFEGMTRFGVNRRWRGELDDFRRLARSMDSGLGVDGIWRGTGSTARRTDARLPPRHLVRGVAQAAGGSRHVDALPTAHYSSASRFVGADWPGIPSCKVTCSCRC